MSQNPDDEEQPTSPKTSGKAVWSLVLGILSFCIPILPAIPAVILGILGIVDVNKHEGRLKGKGLAIAGLVTSAASLVMLPVYIAIVGMLIGFLLPATQKVRGAASRVKSANNLKQIGLAHHNYAFKYNDRLPTTICGPNQDPLLSWRVSILPFVEQAARYDQFNRDQAWDGPQNRLLLDPRPQAYWNPDLPMNSNTTAYRTFVGPGTLYPNPGYQTPYHIANIPDGTSNTVLAAEATDTVPWSKPEELTVTPGRLVDKLGRPGNDYFIVAMMDGSVRIIKKTVSDQTLRNAINPSDGMPLGADW
jgi:hypothetical protein